MIYLIGYYILFGAVSLFSHEVIFEGFSDYDKIKKKHEKNNNVNINNPPSNSDRGQSSTRNNNSGGQNGHNGEEGNARIAENVNEEAESNQKYFKILCFGIMLAYFINKGINIILYHYFLDKYFGNLIGFCIIIYGLSYCLSLFFYLLFYYQLMKIKYLDNQLEKQKKRNNYPKTYRICGYSLYYDKKKINDNENDINIKDIYKGNIDNNNNKMSNKNENNNNYPIFVSLICPKCNYLLEYDKRRINDNENDSNIKNEDNVIKYKGNIDNYNNEISNKNENNNNYPIFVSLNCPKCGYLLYSDKRRINDNENDTKKEVQVYENENNNNKPTFLSLICPKFFKNCRSKKYYCASYKLGFRKFFYRTQKNNISHYLFCCCCDCCKCEKCCCCTCCQCCECCKELELNEMYQEKEIFFYGYKVQGKCSWFCDLLLENQFFLLLIYHNISIEISIIGFEKKINENLESEKIKINLITLSIFLAFFIVYVFIGSNYFFKLIQKKIEKTNFCDFLDFHTVIIVLSVLSFFCRKINDIKDAIDNWVILIPMSYAKFYNFLLIGKLVEAIDNEKDLLTNSFIMSFIFFIYDIIVFIISDLIDCDSDYLILFQFIFSILYFIFFSISIYIYRKNSRT